MTVPKCITEMHDGNKYNLRTIEAQTVQKLKNKKARSKFTGSYKKKCVYYQLYSIEYWDQLLFDGHGFRVLLRLTILFQSTNSLLG